jgi:hypothetical protein
MIQWLVDNKEWLFGGLGVAIIMGALRVFGTSFIKYLNQRLLRTMEREIREKVDDRLEEIIRVGPTIIVDMDLDPNEVEIYCVTYRLNDNRQAPFDEVWVENSKFKIVHVTNDGFSLRKKEIWKELADPSDPYKFFMTVPNSPEGICKYECRLLAAKHTVTGRGEEDEDTKKWRIWFLLLSEPIHPDATNATEVNHTLVNEAFIRNRVYNANKAN